MTTAKHWSGSKLPRLPKKRFTFWNKDSLACAVLGSLLGTYSDLYFVGKGLYHFPYRLLPEIFSIHIVFTLIGLPILTMIFLYSLSQANGWGKAGIILFVSLLMPILEKLAERLGLFAHSDKWLHLYSFFGYLLFFTIISGVYFWLKKRSG
ncbi:CBO0543 family protein [Paenibacillus thiaminolyticus]|uniref:CBO0543 family protein n=1 Tax=Paenibacillus thiaminolyticus TaxID=49283 RepID=UPI0035A6F4CA